jgi:hypothetical protein
MSDWRVPYAALWTIAGAETIAELVRLWTERDGPRLLKAFFQRARKLKQSPYGRVWAGVRKVEKVSTRDPELNEAVLSLHRRINANPVFNALRTRGIRDANDLRIRAIRDAIVVILGKITTFDANKP